MKYKVVLSNDAEDDLFDIFKYLFLHDSKHNADKLVDGLKKGCYELLEYPERGHIPPELQLLYIHDFLEIHFKSYRIIYRINNKHVQVHCVLDGRREMQRLLQERLLK